jgi:hypothetical protein
MNTRNWNIASRPQLVAIFLKAVVGIDVAGLIAVTRNAARANAA